MRSTIGTRQHSDLLSNQPHHYARILLLAAAAGAALLVALLLLATHVEAGASPAASHFDQHMGSCDSPRIDRSQHGPACESDHGYGHSLEISTSAQAPVSQLAWSGKSRPVMSSTLIGRNADGSWVQIQAPVPGWVSAQYIKPTKSLSALPVAVAASP